MSGAISIRDRTTKLLDMPSSLSGQSGKMLAVKGTEDGYEFVDDTSYPTAAIEFTLNDGGVALTTGIKGDIQIPFACTITSATLLADQTGSIVVDIWKDAYANYPPTVADTVTASAKPTLSAAIKSTDSTLTGWTVSISAGDILRFNIDSVATCTRVVLVLGITRI